MGMTHHWCGQYDFCDKMPDDVAKIWNDNLPKYMLPMGLWKNVRYGMPIEHGNFQMMYYNADLFKKAGLNPDQPPKTFDAWHAAMKKATVLDAKGEPTQVGFGLRHAGHPVGITDKFLPFAHAFGARMLSPTLDKATGFANGPAMVEALTFFGTCAGDACQHHLDAETLRPEAGGIHVPASPGSSATKKNAPDITAGPPLRKGLSRRRSALSLTNLVHKEQPEQAGCLGFLRFISNAKDDPDQHQLQGILCVDGKPRPST
jgi:hypothetical protein